MRARRAGNCETEARVFAAVLAEGRDRGAPTLDDPEQTALALPPATNAPLPSAPSTREPAEVESCAGRIAGPLSTA